MLHCRKSKQKSFLRGVMACRLGRVAALPLLLAATACMETASFGDVQTQRHGAQDRLTVVSRPLTISPAGTVRPSQIVCQEPSPDVLEAVQRASSISLPVSVSGAGPEVMSERNIQAALAFSRAQTNAVAQMTERLATIQLLRDGLFRACEAYQMGAVGPITYAMMLSRFGSIMVTLLGSELVAGAFGRELAAAGGGASSNATADTDRSQGPPPGAPSAETRQAERSALTTLIQQSSAARQDALRISGDSTKPDNERNAAADRATQEDANLHLYRQQLRQLNASESTSLRATTAAATEGRARAGGGITGRTQPDDGIARTIARMQEQYFEAASDVSPMLLACMTALQRTEAALPPPGAPADREWFTGNTQFAIMCRNGLLERLVQIRGESLARDAESRNRIELLRAQRRLAEAEAELARERRMAGGRPQARGQTPSPGNQTANPASTNDGRPFREPNAPLPPAQPGG